MTSAKGPLSSFSPIPFRRLRPGSAPRPYRSRRMNALISRSALVIACAVGMLGVVAAEDWPGFRGNHGGVAVPQDLPTKLTKETLLWKLKMPGVGTSSPITYG